MPKIVDCKGEKSFIRRNETTEQYFAEIRRFPVLTYSQQRDLLITIKTSKNEQKVKEARDKLINCNQRFVFSIARKWNVDGNVMDLVNEANIALIHAIEKYDLNKDEHFLTYAIYWMRKAINNYVMNRQVLVRAPNLNKIQPQLKKVVNDFYNRNERYPTSDEIKAILQEDYDITVLSNNDVTSFDYFSLDDAFNGNEDDTRSAAANGKINDVLSRTSSNNIEKVHDEEYINDKLARVMSVLSDREKYVIQHVYGLMGYDQESYDVIAVELGLCRERIRQVHNEALKKMKNMVVT